MNSLPDEMLENVLANVNVLDLFKSCVFVCKKWYKIICNEKFVRWKKLYALYSMHNSKNLKAALNDICISHNITGKENCLIGLINYLSESRDTQCRTMRYLRCHPLFSLAEKLIIEQGQQLSVWRVTILICIIARDAWEVYSLLNLLTHARSDCTIMEATEKLYRVCTFFLYFTREFQIPAKLHYNLRYALNLFETDWSSPSEGNQSVPGLTPEQSRIVNHRIERNHLIKIVAFAGSGKTTTLLRLTERVNKENPHFRFLLVVYNRAVSDEASGKFPNNVVCRTIHQLAYRHTVGQGLLKKKATGNIYPTSLIDSGILKDRRGMRRYQREKLVIDTLHRFWGSADDSITVDHTPIKVINNVLSQDSPIDQPVREKILSVEERKMLAADAKKVWSVLKNPNDDRLKLPCDAYLKIWQLQKPNLFESEEVDCVMVDEGQDLNGAMLDIFLRHPGPRIIVGDPHQQIYRWRYAVNALNKVPATHTFYLTQSFRFGPEIGFMANSCLSVLNNVNDKCLVGINVRDRLNSATHPLDVALRSGRQFCFLARTNLTLFKKAVQVLGYDTIGNSQTPKPKIAFAGGLKAMNLDLLLDVNHLRQGALDKIVSPFLRNRRLFGNFSAFIKYVETTMDMEWGARIAQVNWSGSNTEKYVEAIRSANVHISEADVVFSTAHKSKGMEWDTVALLDDFVPTLVSARVTEEQQEERNLLYVAVTRAKRNLVINPACYYTLLAVGDRQESIVDTNTYIDIHGPSPTCARCHQILPGRCKARSASFCSTRLVLMTIRSQPLFAATAGILCAACAGLHCYMFQRYECYAHELPQLRVREDRGHLTFRFLVGPSADEKHLAETYYEEQHALMNDGFINAGRLLPGPPVVVNNNNVLQQVHQVAVINDVIDNDLVHLVPPNLNHQDLDVNAFPDDDDMFLEVEEEHLPQPEIPDEDDAHRDLLIHRLSQ
ncbi:F-box DNA helicase 1 isoform X1 [Daphnia magna]|uniref:F-box DNA helicase 1 isoform X1 n=2 Tax=Daphnia magna TaxID=35525 RepID=UPI001E1BCD0F|nr:F-box DNA helicase 1 isoform X1 [Daphnia magna]XP_045025570.1 F-box DNA helicase 1 isoform X1 [Daphnia magna]XP_045025571.1 F-box DNA helicase 1 isoform X1 [Daphnia magna]